MADFEFLFRIYCQPELFYRKIQEDKTDAKSFDAIRFGPHPLKTLPTGVRLIVSGSGKFPDAIFGHFMYLVLSDVACDILLREAGDDLEHFPAPLFDQNGVAIPGYQLVNFFKNIRCLDIEESGARLKPGTDEVTYIRNYVVDPTRVPAELKAFRMKEYFPYTLVKESVLKGFKNKKLTGFWFEKLPVGKKFHPSGPAKFERGMGAWFNMNFDDEANFWLSLLTTTSDLSVVENVIPENPRDLSFSQSTIALAAAEVVAAMKGRPAMQHPEVHQYVKNCRKLLTESLVDRTLNVVRDIESSSELQREVDASGRDERWHWLMRDLIERLGVERDKV